MAGRVAGRIRLRSMENPAVSFEVNEDKGYRNHKASASRAKTC